MAPHVIHLAPHFPANQRRYARGLANVGAVVSGIGDLPYEHLDGELRAMLHHYEYVRNVTDEEQVYQAVRRIQARGPWVHRFEATIESHMLCAARVRERTGIPGLPYETVNLCRDKFVMKRFLREHGIPSARNAEVHTAADAAAFAAEVGYPFVLKPRDGAGAHATYKIEGEADLARAVGETGLDPGPRYFTAEEFVSGHEGFYDTLTVDGHVVYEFVSHYYPNVLEAMRTRWISPQIVTTNRVESGGYEEVRALGRKVVAAFGLGTTATHMEWFFGPKGLQFSEIGARPPGCNFWDTYCEANDFDLYTEWARALCWGDVRASLSRRYTSGLIAIRPSQDGTVKGYSGLEEIERRYARHIWRVHLPPAGSRTQPVDAGFLANAYFCAKHEDYDTLRGILDDIGRTVKMWAS